MSERGDFRCDDCGLVLSGVALPVHHHCRGGKNRGVKASERRIGDSPSRSDESSFVYRGGRPDCIHLGEETGVVVRCACPASELVPLLACAVHGTTTTVPVRAENARRAVEKDGRGLALPVTNCRDCGRRESAVSRDETSMLGQRVQPEEQPPSSSSNRRVR